MAKGGSRGRAGRIPEPDALRRDRPSDIASWVDLPAHREGAVPEWPLAAAVTRELDLWAGEWRRPQAVMWERNGQELEVAMYVRSLVDAESHDASVASRTLLKQLQEALGLSIPGMLRNRWRIPPDVAPKRKLAPVHAEDGVSMRDRLRMVSGGGV